MKKSLRALSSESTRKLYKLEDFRKADIVERCYIKVMMGEHPSFRLSPKEQEQFEWMETAYSLQREKRARWPALQALRQLLRDESARHWSAELLMDQAEQLFSRFERTDRPTQRGIIREQLLKRVDYCETRIAAEETKNEEKPMWEKLIQGYWKQLADLDQVSVIEEAGEADNSLAPIIFTNDPASLLDSMAEDAEIEEE